MQMLGRFSFIASSLTVGFRGCCLRVHPTHLRGIHHILYDYSLGTTRLKAGLQHCCLLSTVVRSQDQSKLDSLTSRKFTLIYKFPAMRFMRAVSRLKLLQTGITLLLLPPVYYFYFQGHVTYALVSYSTGIALFAAAMLYCLSHYLRRIVGMMYLDHSRTTLKVSHLTFWGKRHDIYVPVADIMTVGDTGDTRNETLLRLKRYSSPDVLYFSTQLGHVVDKEGFAQVFGSFS